MNRTENILKYYKEELINVFRGNFSVQLLEILKSRVSEHIDVPL
jgi:hypothetical protein